MSDLSKRHRKRLGNMGEILGRQRLEQLGLEILYQNWRYGRLGEIDLVALAAEGEILVFAEVKTRQSGAYQSAVESITPKKQQQLIALAEAFLGEHPQYGQNQVRFDLLAFWWEENDGQWRHHHLQDVFSG